MHGASKPLIFISDLHLQDRSPALTNALVRFLAEQSGSCGALYILGDLFEVWLGDDDTGRCGTKFLRRCATSPKVAAGCF